MTRTFFAVSLVLASALAASPVAAAEVAPGVHLLPGSFVPGTQPDGNTVIFVAPEGLIVMDTGRHREHTQGIVAFAKEKGVAVKAILNSHWHLDHIGGNPLLRQEFPGVRVYAAPTLEEAMKGFLASYRAYLEDAVKKGDEEAQKPLRAELAILDAGKALAPDEPVTSSGPRTIAGKELRLELETHAVTAGDLWALDPATGVLAAGDLVTLPAPFLDTACPARWQAALDHLAKADFKILIPGHGPAMTRADFETYRQAFGALLACAASAKAKDECIGGWLRDIGKLVPEQDHTFTRSLLDYYVENHLRGDPAKTAKLCAG
jgi:glyoxylase-like metal-dependent hydrolase (beta-lactamase superfamily II)